LEQVVYRGLCILNLKLAGHDLQLIWTWLQKVPYAAEVLCL
jgi:hypothetical protein